MLKIVVLCAALATAVASAQVPAADPLQKYRDRIAGVYIPMGLTPGQVVEYARRYFGREFQAVENKDGSVDFVYIQRRDGNIVLYEIVASAPPK